MRTVDADGVALAVADTESERALLAEGLTDRVLRAFRAEHVREPDRGNVLRWVEDGLRLEPPARADGMLTASVLRYHEHVLDIFRATRVDTEQRRTWA
ncbi:MAG: hypothetical protein M0013_12360 [Actinomycetota bacterium]|jgi:hypothetical protein|nr:hypothetical protein [Actinomycetota bacterium]